MSKKIYLIDWNSFIYRMYFALPEFSTKDGRVVNATFWMAKFFVWQLVKEKPDYVVFIKDAKWKNFRHDIYAEYKATRERMPDTLRSQIGDIEELIARMHIDIVEIEWYEADDVIWTLAKDLSKNSNNEIYILSGDKDLYALIDEQVKVYDTQRKKISGPEETFSKFWVPANCVRDYLAICGDTSDNIPGIAGIWPKKAQVLLNEFGTLEKIYETIDDIESTFDSLTPESQKVLKWKTLEKFIDGKENAFLSQKLATLDCNVELPWFDLEDYSFSPKEIQTPELFEYFKELEFHSLLTNNQRELSNWEKVWEKVNIIWDTSWLDELYKKIEKTKTLTLDTETTSLNPKEANLVWISLRTEDEQNYYINVMHRWPQVPCNKVKDFLSSLMSIDILIIGHNLKYDLQIIENFIENKNSQMQEQESPDDWQMALEL